MPTSFEHDPKYRYRKINRGRHTLEMRTNGTKHDIPVKWWAVLVVLGYLLLH